MTFLLVQLHICSVPQLWMELFMHNWAHCLHSYCRASEMLASVKCSVLLTSWRGGEGEGDYHLCTLTSKLTAVSLLAHLSKSISEAQSGRKGQKKYTG